jgi:hypothetical protein
MRNVYMKHPRHLGRAVLVAIAFALIAYGVSAHEYEQGEFLDGDFDHDGYTDSMFFERESDGGMTTESGIYLLDGACQCRSDVPIIPATDVTDIRYHDTPLGSYIILEQGHSGQYSQKWYSPDETGEWTEADPPAMDCLGTYVDGWCYYDQGSDEGTAAELLDCIEGTEVACRQWPNSSHIWRHTGSAGPVTIRVWRESINYEWETTLDQVSLCGPEESSWMDPRYEYKICEGNAAAFISPTCNDASVCDRIQGWFDVQAFQGAYPVGLAQRQYFDRP